MDDRRAVGATRAKGFTVIGTLGILDLAARRGMLDLSGALALLRNTNFRMREKLLDALLAQHEAHE
jgi:predicted nucleic acid-binding protein